MEPNIMIYGYVIVLLGIVVCLWVLKAICSKVVLKPEKAFPSKQEFIIKHTKQINIIARAIGISFVAVSLFLIIIPAIIDLPMALSGQYEISYCQTIDDDLNREGVIAKRDVHFITDDGKLLNLRVFSAGYKKGEEYVVHYLPHMKIGCMYRNQ